MFHSKEDRDVSESEVHVLYLIFLIVCATGVVCLALLRRPKRSPSYSANVDSKLSVEKVNEAYKHSESDLSSIEADTRHSGASVPVTDNAKQASAWENFGETSFCLLPKIYEESQI